MKKFILLFAMLMTVGAASAIEDKASNFGTPASSAAYGNIYTWTATYNNLVQCFSFSSGELVNYDHLHFVISNMSGGGVRIYVKCSDNTDKSTSYYTANGTDKNVALTDLLPSGKSLADVTQISFGGVDMGKVVSGDNSSPARTKNYVKINLSEMYLSKEGSEEVLYATPGTPAGNATYTENTLAWSSSSNNLMDLFSSLAISEVNNYTSLKFSVSNLTGGALRIGYYVGDTFTEIGTGYYSDGDKTTDLIGQTTVDLSTITKLVIGGRSIDATVEYNSNTYFKGVGTCVIDPSSVVLSNDALNRTFTANQLSTVCLPFALTAEEAAGAGKFYTLGSLDGSSIKFTEVDGATSAYTPYVFKPSSATPFASLSKTCVYPKGSCTTSAGGATFTGVLKAGSVEEGAYGYSGGSFKKAGTSVTIKAFRAYITAPSSSAHELSISLGDDVTGISKIQTETSNDAPIYNLNGQRVGADYKGIVIKDGKKVIQK
ncbi:MAG: hypothetical protein IJ552_03985 [Prevotella sp.]|nr:hypothetical protein [Prevotella sp.]